MCGIAGFVRSGGARQDDDALLGAMCDAITHRGPDDEGRQIIGGAALGMRRLSIIDVAGGHQPIANETGDVTVVYVPSVSIKDVAGNPAAGSFTKFQKMF